MITEINRGSLTPSFDDPASGAGPTRLSYRNAYYHLVNVEEHPEVLPLAYDLVTHHLERVSSLTGHLTTGDVTPGSLAARLAEVLNRLEDRSARFSRPWRTASEDLTRRQVLHYFVQYIPTALVDGCWL